MKTDSKFKHCWCQESFNLNENIEISIYEETANQTNYSISRQKEEVIDLLRVLYIYTVYLYI